MNDNEPVFLIIGLVGLRSCLGHRGGRAATVGLVALVLSGLEYALIRSVRGPFVAPVSSG